jgi:hypothetical protein
MKLTKHKINKKINKNMIIRKNNKMQTNFVYNSAAKVETFISYPFAGTKRAGTRLTIRNGKTRIDLNGRQVKALRKVLATASRVK